MCVCVWSRVCRGRGEIGACAGPGMGLEREAAAAGPVKWPSRRAYSALRFLTGLREAGNLQMFLSGTQFLGLPSGSTDCCILHQRKVGGRFAQPRGPGGRENQGTCPAGLLREGQVFRRSLESALWPQKRGIVTDCSNTVPAASAQPFPARVSLGPCVWVEEALPGHAGRSLRLPGK